MDGILFSAAANAEDHAAYLAAVEAALPENMLLEDDVLTWLEEDGNGRVLDCAMKILPLSSSVRSQWLRHNLTVEIGEGDDSWDW